MNKISYLWGAAHTATTVQQSSQSLQSKEWHLLVIQGAAWFYQPTLPCDNRLRHPLICGLRSCDPLHLTCKLGWTVSELTFTALSCAILFSTLNTKSKKKLKVMPVFIIRRENRAALTWATYLKLWALLILSSADDKNKRRYWHCTAGAESDVVNIQGLAHLRGFLGREPQGDFLFPIYGSRIHYFFEPLGKMERLKDQYDMTPRKNSVTNLETYFCCAMLVWSSQNEYLADNSATCESMS